VLRRQPERLVDLAIDKLQEDFNDIELTSMAVFKWCQESGIEWRCIAPGKSTQNAFVESFNGRFRDKCLNDNLFATLVEALVFGRRETSGIANDIPVLSCANMTTPLAIHGRNWRTEARQQIIDTNH